MPPNLLTAPKYALTLTPHQAKKLPSKAELKKQREYTNSKLQKPK